MHDRPTARGSDLHEFFVYLNSEKVLLFATFSH